MEFLKGTDLSGRFDLEYLREELSRRSAYVWICALVLALLVFMAVTDSIASKREDRLAQKESEIGEFYALINEYKADISSIGYLREKLLSRGVDVSTGTVIEEIAAGIGLKKKITSFKPLTEGVVNGYMEKGVQVEIEGITLNQVVNLLYKIKGHKNLLLIRGFSMKSHFQNPDMLDMTIQVILITKAAGL